MEIEREPTATRIVPSGKVYKQIFDAQVQLVKALESRQPTTIDNADHKTTADPREKHIPLVKDIPGAGAGEAGGAAGRGMLTGRQKTWIDGFPNEDHVENPVLVKFYNRAHRQQALEPESSVASKEVQGLPDVLTPAKKGSDIIERIAESRKLRHENFMEDMYQELGVISTELEPTIVDESKKLLALLDENDSKIRKIMCAIDEDEDLVQFSLNELEDLWTSVQSQSRERHSWIEDLDRRLADIEIHRMDQVRDIFQHGAETLKKIAHLMPPDLERLLAKEAQLINQTALSNRRSRADLRYRLMTSDIERERQLHTTWSRRVAQWKQLHTHGATHRFRNYMDSEDVCDPPGVRKVKDDMMKHQTEKNNVRLDLVSSLRDMMPPNSTKTSVYRWNQEITVISKEIDELNQSFFAKLYAEYEKVCQECLDEAERVKVDLIERQVCDEQEAASFLKDVCLPVIGKKQARFEKDLEVMDRKLEQHNEHILLQLKSLFKFAQGAAHVWDIHEIGLARQERALQEKLDECRHKHDSENQEKEANLDMVMDKMRQDATEQALKENLKKSLDCLIKIRESYDSFHNQQCHIVNGYPSMVHDELERYDRAVCKFFSLDRQHPELTRSETPHKDEGEGQKSDKRRKRKKPPPAGATGRDGGGSRASSRGSSDSDGQPTLSVSTLPQVVSEVLKTARGTSFYVLTVAGEHGVPAPLTEAAGAAGAAAGQRDNRTGGGAPQQRRRSKDSDENDDENTNKQTSGDGVVRGTDVGLDGECIAESINIEDGAGSPAFLTESSYHMGGGDARAASSTTQPQEGSGAGTTTGGEAEVPFYIVNVHVSDAFILDVKKAIRMNFLNHIDDWVDEALKRSRTVVAAKLEEMSSELDLRIHLHDPRPHRAELDVHNVRAAELVMHNERVSRHCKGVTQALTNLKNEFTSLTEEHNEWSSKYRHDIESLERVFVDATKSSKLVALSNQLQVEQDKYMDRVRASLREFRQKLDNTLQMLRGSNARFINSFKLFSDGGNFCPEEIEEYKSRLSKMSQKIDAAEGFVMADLEGMEARRLDQAIKVSAEFEDRFKHHMIDLLFMEKIARWLTNTQVKIKSEVADSNTQAKQILQALSDLQRRVDACERPNLDKESVSPAQLRESLPVLFDMFYQRSVYLNCLKDNTPRPASATTLQGNPALGARGDTTGGGAKVGFSSEVAAITAVSRPGKQPAEDPSVSVIRNILKTQKNRLQEETPDETPRHPPTMAHAQQAGAVPEKSKASRPPTDQESHRSRRSSKQGGPALSNAGNSDPPSNKRATSGPKHSKGTKIEKRMLVFGESEIPGESTHILGRIQKLLREALDGLLAASDLFYRQKGNRAVTRPQALQETFETCADVIIQKLLSYYTQADEYHNHCLQEFRSQLMTLEDEVGAVPRAVIKEYLRVSCDTAINDRKDKDEKFDVQLHQLQQLQIEHNTVLRPSLGHPNQTQELAELCGKEEKRREQYVTAVNAHSKQLQEKTAEYAADFIQGLARIGEQLLLQFDNLLTVDDVSKGRVPATKYPTSELVRRKNAGQPLEDVEPKTVRPRGRKTWPGISKTELVLASDEPKREIDRVRLIKERGHVEPVTASVTTSKTTLGHDATLQARDKAYQDYKCFFEDTLASIEGVCSRQMVAEERWTESWKISVEKVKQLY